MRTGAGLLFAAVTALAVLCALFAARLAGHVRSARAEFAEAKILRISAPTRDRLASLDDRVFLTYFVSSRARMPSAMRHVERDVLDLLDALRAASGGKLDYQVVDPDADPELRKYAAAHGAAPFRARSIERDAYSETTVWSTLVIAYGSRREVAIAGIGPEHVRRLQGLVVAHLDELERPRKPVVAVAAPAGYEKFRAWVAQEAELVTVDLERGDRPPAGADVLFWFEPHGGDDALRLLDDWLARGRSAIVAGSGRAGQIALADTEPLFQFDERGAGPVARVFAHFGLRRLPELLLDERSMSATLGEKSLPVPYLLRCVAADQDFRTMRGQPNGTLVFSAPAPFVIDPDELGARGHSADVLATSSERSWTAPIPAGPVPPGAIARDEGRAVGKQPLAVRLRPRDPWHGSLVAFAAATPFQDGWFDRENTAHARLAKTLVEELASAERRVIHGAGILRHPPLPALDAASRVLWRALVVGLLPALLVGVALSRRVVGIPRRSAALRPATLGRLGAGAAVVAAVLLAARGIDAAGLRRDLGEGRPGELAPATRELAARAEFAAEFVFTRRASLPPSMRAWEGRVGAALDDLRRAGARLRVRRIDPGDLGDGERAALAAEGIAPFQTTSRDEEVTTVRSVYAALRLTSGSRSEVLRFEDAASIENLEFRLACALSRLETGRRTRIAFAAAPPRLTPAEAHADIKRGLVAPTGTDAFALARRVLEANDFEVVHVDPRRPTIPDATDALLCFQPRLDAVPMYEALASYLHGGGRALLALQHYNLQARQFRGAAFAFVYWPQPQWPEIERLWFPELGIEAVPEVLFDERRTRIDAETQVNRGSAIRPDLERQTSALPFVLRAPAASFSQTSPILRGVGDQAFVWAARLRWDDAKLAAAGLRATTLIETSERTWTYAWKGGYLPEELLRGPPEGADGRPAYLGHLPLAAAFEGVFPLPVKPLREPPQEVDADPQLAEAKRMLQALEDATVGEHPGPVAPAHDEPQRPAPAAAPGKLVLVGCSEMFKDRRLLDPAFRADHLLLNVVAHLALPPELADVVTRRRVPRGFEPPEEDVRSRWRIVVLAAFPGALLLFGTLRTLLGRRAASRRSA